MLSLIPKRISPATRPFAGVLVVGTTRSWRRCRRDLSAALSHLLDLLVIGWGGTCGAITSAVEKVRKRGGKVSSAHLRYLNPFPPNLGDVLARFDKVLVPELNLGQLYFLLRGKFSHEMFPLNKVQGLPFKVSGATVIRHE